MLSSSKEKFHHKFIDVGPIENLKLAVKWFNWKNNENKLESGSFKDLLKKLDLFCFVSICFSLAC